MHVDPPPSTLIKSKNDEKPDKYFIKIKLRKDPTSEKLDLYECKMDLFDNVHPEELLLFIRNFNMTMEESGTLNSGVKIQYLCTLVCG